MGRLIDVDDLINYLGFKDTQEERENNYAEDITLEEIDRIETVNVAEREEVKKLVREEKKKAIDEFCEELRNASVYVRPIGWFSKQQLVELEHVGIIAKDIKEKIDAED